MIRWAITAAVLLTLIATVAIACSNDEACAATPRPRATMPKVLKATPKAPKATKTNRTRGVHVDVDLDTRTC